VRIVLILAALALAGTASAQSRGFETRESCLRQLSMAIASADSFEGSAGIYESMAEGTPAAEAERFPEYVEGLRMISEGWRMRRDALMSICEAYSTNDMQPATFDDTDIDALRLAIEECWNVGILSSDALQVAVTIGFEMSRDSRPIPGTIRLLDAVGGSGTAQMTAFEAGRRAIEECGANGFGLPAGSYDQWRIVEITLDPERFRQH